MGIGGWTQMGSLVGAMDNRVGTMDRIVSTIVEENLKKLADINKIVGDLMEMDNILVAMGDQHLKMKAGVEMLEVENH